MNEHYNHYNENRRIKWSNVKIRWFKFGRTLIIFTIVFLVVNYFRSDVRQCTVITSYDGYYSANCSSDIFSFDNDDYRGNVNLSEGDSVNVYISKINGEIRKVKINYSLLNENE